MKGNLFAASLLLILLTGVPAASAQPLLHFSHSHQLTVQVYPNPSTGYFFVKSSKKIFLLQVFMLTGQQVHFYVPHSEKHLLNLQHLVPGIYLLKVTTSGGVVNKRLVVM